MSVFLLADLSSRLGDCCRYVAKQLVSLMQSLKKRVRLLTEKIGGEISYRHDGGLTVRHGSNSVLFAPVSVGEMHATINVHDHSASYQLSKNYVFDIVDRLGSTHLASSLLAYEQKPIAQLEDYIREEYGQPFLDDLRKQIADDPSITHAELGGNRIRVEYHAGVLIISDDILWLATNVVDF